ncbi:bifunctional WXG100 family type VII secretion target/C40 family peptidase [Nonomuraea rhodomycinica]|uniref:C40 family peptidase n=1 Tax=Nonomuraea rhodomycinica TaxID=1712872 RepID=A0A7Y6ME39_9ACTN|nr:NlpC/P60 family protein [Nonomuraea rhodomycinica]NUW44507.1 C40 family peptidase [Nonomuraea rhodomycinica]
MGASETVDGLPGDGSKLAGILEKLTGDPSGIREVAKRWRGTAGKVSTGTGKLGTAVKNINAGWQGGSAEDFVTYMRDYQVAGDALHDILSGCAGSLDTVADEIEKAHSKVNSLCEGVLAQVRSFRKANPDASQKDFDAAIAPVVSLARGEAEKHLAAAEGAVNDAEKAIRAKIKAKHVSFKGIKQVSDDPFGTTGWQPTPVPKFGTTSLAGYDGGGGNGGAAPGGYSGGTGAVATSFSGGGGTPVPIVVGNGTGADIVNAARQHLGKPYIWGANGPSAFDCSGLVYYAMNQAGIKVGDATAESYRVSGQAVTGPPQPGDLVFFGQPATHVGIYIGDGQMIHAPKPGDVVKQSSVASNASIGVVSYRRFT